jgi:choice-of-anchor I-like protein
VSLERNNALAVVDLHRAKVIDILPLGSKDHGLAGSGFDASDKDGAINIETWPVRSFYSPDGTAAVGSGRRTFVVTANEGDPVDFEGFSERVRLKDLPLDPTEFPDAETLKMDENLGQLQVTTVDGDVDGDEDYDEIFMLGSRSFAIWSADGQLIFDSGDDFEQIIAEAVPDYFNAPEDENEFDARSDDRGPEPEPLTVGRIGPRTYVFVAFERIGGVIVYDLTDPYEPRFQQYINYRNFDVEPKAVCGTRGQPELPGCEIVGDLEPEGLVFIAARESPIGVPLLAVIHELSDSTTLYRINRVRRSSQQCEAR